MSFIRDRTHTPNPACPSAASESESCDEQRSECGGTDSLWGESMLRAGSCTPSPSIDLPSATGLRSPEQRSPGQRFGSHEYKLGLDIEHLGAFGACELADPVRCPSRRSALEVGELVDPACGLPRRSALSCASLLQLPPASPQ